MSGLVYADTSGGRMVAGLEAVGGFVKQFLVGGGLTGDDVQVCMMLEGGKPPDGCGSPVFVSVTPNRTDVSSVGCYSSASVDVTVVVGFCVPFPDCVGQIAGCGHVHTVVDVACGAIVDETHVDQTTVTFNGGIQTESQLVAWLSSLTGDLIAAEQPCVNECGDRVADLQIDRFVPWKWGNGWVGVRMLGTVNI